MTKKPRNYVKIVGSRAFVESASNLLEPKYDIIYQTPIRESDSEPDIFFVYVNIAYVFLEPVEALGA